MTGVQTCALPISNFGRGFKLALVNCPECDKLVSDKAESCPNCGYPILKNFNQLPPIAVKSDLVCPELPSDLDVGKHLSNWVGDAHINGRYENSGNPKDKIPTGKIGLFLHKKGISFTLLFIQIATIHYSQIISVEEIYGDGLKDKSVIGRAVVGAVVLGPIGAIVGGLSGLGSKNVKNHYLIINYWDANSRELTSVSFMGDKMTKFFIARLNQAMEEWRKNK